jgi:hypothetical protein
MRKELENLVAARQLKTEPSSPDEVAVLFKRAAGLLTDAGNTALGPASRFALAYDAAFALATAALRSAGFRADAARGHRGIPLTHPTTSGPGSLRHTSGETLSSTARPLSPSVAEANDLVALARKLDTLVRTSLKNSRDARSR